MRWVFQPLQEDQALTILTWRYSPPYDYYNPNPATREADLPYLLQPENAFWAILNEPGELEGFCSFGADGQVPGGNYRPQALDIGMGLLPDLVGQGRGCDYARAIAEFGATRYQADQLRVTIAEFNQRAQRVWQRLGFVPVSRFVSPGTTEACVVLVRAATATEEQTVS